MRFILGPIPPSHVLSPREEGWTPLREPTSGVFVAQVLLLSLPFLVLALFILPELEGYARTQPLPFYALVTFFVFMTPMHEAIHALVYPGGLRSKHLVVGVWMRRGMCYVVYDTPLPRNRILLMLSAPFVVMSFFLVVIACLAPSAWRPVALLLLFVHTAVCTGDFLTFVRLFRQAPTHALVHNDGWKTYWKLTSQRLAH